MLSSELPVVVSSRVKSIGHAYHAHCLAILRRRRDVRNVSLSRSRSLYE
jgi:hypothetical protein